MVACRENGGPCSRTHCELLPHARLLQAALQEELVNRAAFRDDLCVMKQFVVGWLNLGVCRVLPWPSCKLRKCPLRHTQCRARWSLLLPSLTFGCYTGLVCKPGGSNSNAHVHAYSPQSARACRCVATVLVRWKLYCTHTAATPVVTSGARRAAQPDPHQSERTPAQPAHVRALLTHPRTLARLSFLRAHARAERLRKQRRRVAQRSTRCFFMRQRQ